MLHPDTRKLDPREQHVWTPGPIAGLDLFLRHLSPEKHDHPVRPVLYVHGATFPSALSIAHRFDGWSWRDALCAAGFDVWALDFYGYGCSGRYEEMSQPAEQNSPLLRTADAADQVEAAVRFILQHHEVPNLSIISHSWGSMPSCLVAAKHPTLIERLILFAPVARRPPRRYERPASAPAWRLVTLEDQWTRFTEDQPPHEPPVLSRAHFAEWGSHYLDSDPEGRTRTPPSVKTPTGPFVDILHAWHGDLAYDPAKVQSSVAIMRGAWDGLIPDEDARWLFDAFSAAPIKRDIKIGRGTHLLHLEEMRFALYRESISFLQGGDRAPAKPPNA